MQIKRPYSREEDQGHCICHWGSTDLPMKLAKASMNPNRLRWTGIIPYTCNKRKTPAETGVLYGVGGRELLPPLRAHAWPIREREAGIEPAPQSWKDCALPLSYSRLCGAEKNWTSDLLNENIQVLSQLSYSPMCLSNSSDFMKIHEWLASQFVIIF